MPSNDDSTFGDLPRRKGTKVVKFFFSNKRIPEIIYINTTRQPISKFIIKCIILQSWKVFWKILEFFFFSLMEDLNYSRS